MRWKPFSRLFLASDNAEWTISEDMRELADISRRLGVRVSDPRLLKRLRSQAVFYGEHYQGMAVISKGTVHRVATAYFHGRPGMGVEEFDRSFEILRQHHHRLQRIQVTNHVMRDVVLSSGISENKVFEIPIGINLSYFTPPDAESRRRARECYDVPQSAVVVGSFQKDGVGWGAGLQPKLIKGPDVFLQTVEILKRRVPELFVLLSGPARGYVKYGLECLGVPFRHVFLSEYTEIRRMYHALDVYVVASREEGGPKAILESMATGVPLVTTRVGQAMSLVHHGVNGWMVDVEDSEGLAYWAEYAIHNRAGLEAVISQAYQTGESNSYEAQTPLWRRFMDGFVEILE